VPTLAERKLKKVGKLIRPTEFIPNGCGPKAGTGLTALLVPDELAGVKFGEECCNPHDLAYYVGGFWGLFCRKPRADIGLGACLADRFMDAAKVRWYRRTWTGRLKAVGTAVLGIVAGVIFALAVLALGWTPLTWRWRKRPPPSDEELTEVKNALRNQGS
jgi:hypothetical protein